MGSLGWAEILMILVVALIIFGPRKLPELGKSLGQSLAQFRRASEDFKRTWEDEVEMEKRRLDSYTSQPFDSQPEPTYDSWDAVNEGSQAPMEAENQSSGESQDTGEDQAAGLPTGDASSPQAASPEERDSPQA